ncbi:unnamed protein product [Cyprideis torosa]|uniref:Uncharacterized protein n=1 Tax=Cyprideis torosa TaxID=163714 RepID=A0A7R8W9U4_9CRUS|nr:unnamed protein product [Cyprideis torosa]CAG0885708.1 unnamed protein product [Cyprideis torosa]
MSTSTPVSQRVYALRNRGSSHSSSPVQLPATPDLQKVGFGTGVGVFHLLRHPKSGGSYRSPWAVKKFSWNIRGKREGEAITKRLNREAEVLKRLKHPNVIGFRQWTNDADGNPALMMEFGEKSLADLIQERDESNPGESFPEDKIIRVAQDVVSAVHYLHTTQQLLHGDIKSNNVLVLGNFETCKLCDFGVVCKLDRNMKLRKGETYIGTQCWSAPEVLGDGDVCDKSDIYSYALTLYEMVALRVPHLDDTAEDESMEDDESFQQECEEQFEQRLGTLSDGNLGRRCQCVLAQSGFSVALTSEKEGHCLRMMRSINRIRPSQPIHDKVLEQLVDSLPEILR